MKKQSDEKKHDVAVGELFPAQQEVPNCFGCGQKNPSGLRLRFRRHGPLSVSTEFTAPRDWTGWSDMLHGGFHSFLLDEITAWVPFAILEERSFVTKEMQIRYLKPGRVGRPLTIVGHLMEDKGREILVRGEIRDERGTVLSEAVCTLVRVSREAFEKIAASTVYEKNE